ncbi:hypothetical protein AAHN93_14425 [Vandammella animalimorsus]|uniref:hypothetical protein n=1 Tax=Vandammella animalimorsus TaxID=2029117 RepID=UPI0031BA1A7C
MEAQDPRGNTLDFHKDGIRHSGVDGWAMQFVRDAQGRISQIYGAGQTHHYQYDSAGKPTQEQITQAQPTAQTLTIAYQYDKVGNRTARTVSGAIQQTTTYLHPPGGVGELISQSDGTTTKQIYADAQGTTRLIADSYQSVC